METGDDSGTGDSGGEGEGGSSGGSEGDSSSDSIDFSSGGVFSWIAQGFKNVISAITSILDYLNPTSENFFVYKLIDLLKDLLKFLFVPSDGYLEGKVNSIKDKFAFIDSINGTINDIVSVVKNEDSVPVFYINILENKYYNGKVKILDLSWYAPYKQYGDTIICCFAYAFFFWRTFINLSGIISGTSGSIVSVNSEINDMTLYKQTGKKYKTR